MVGFIVAISKSILNLNYFMLNNASLPDPRDPSSYVGYIAIYNCSYVVYTYACDQVQALQ